MVVKFANIMRGLQHRLRNVNRQIFRTFVLAVIKGLFGFASSFTYFP